jgi:hypothetical protein
MAMADSGVAAQMTLSGVWWPPNATAIFSHHWGSPAGCFTICRWSSSSSWSVHSPASSSSSLSSPFETGAVSHSGCHDAGWTGAVGLGSAADHGGEQALDPAQVLRPVLGRGGGGHGRWRCHRRWRRRA